MDSFREEHRGLHRHRAKRSYRRQRHHSRHRPPGRCARRRARVHGPARGHRPHRRSHPDDRDPVWGPAMHLPQRHRCSREPETSIRGPGDRAPQRRGRYPYQARIRPLRRKLRRTRQGNKEGRRRRPPQARQETPPPRGWALPGHPHLPGHRPHTGPAK